VVSPRRDRVARWRPVIDTKPQQLAVVPGAATGGDTAMKVVAAMVSLTTVAR
jgi:hypothetical protein